MIPATDIEALGVPVPSCRAILIVDDLLPNLDVLEALLDEEYDVVRATSGPEALSLLDRGVSVDLVISDQRMPGMTGIELLTEITRRQPDIERMVLTAYADIGPILAAIELGSVRRFMLKPWDADEMLRAVDEALESRQRRLLVRQLAAALEERVRALRRALAERDHAVARLAMVERLALVGRMAAGVSHDMRNQLTVLQLIVERFATLSRDPSLQDHARDAIASLRTLLQLVQDVTSFARRQPLRLQYADLPPERLVADVMRLVSLERNDAVRRVRVEVAPDVRAVCGDVGRLTQATLALLRTALTESSSEVDLRIERIDGHVALQVAYDAAAPARTAPEARATIALNATADDEIASLGWTVAHLVADAHAGRLDVDERGGRRRATLHVGGSA